ncbi:hypothetical protein Efla_001536 [Eimeria flavescens]
MEAPLVKPDIAASANTAAGSCELLGEFGTFGWWLQGVLGVLSFGSLLAKRKRENPKRPWKVFLFDCSKQASGAFFIHMLNLGGAGLMAAVFEQDVCVWYWLNIMVDTTLGVYFQYLMLQAARRLFKGATCLEYGNYGAPPRWSACFSQGLSWLVFCLMMKLAACAFMLALQGPLGASACGGLLPCCFVPPPEPTVVMVATPLVMNSVQYWLTDGFIQRREAPTRQIPVYNVVQTTEDVTPGCSRRE